MYNIYKKERRKQWNYEKQVSLVLLVRQISGMSRKRRLFQVETHCLQPDREKLLKPDAVIIYSLII